MVSATASRSTLRLDLTVAAQQALLSHHLDAPGDRWFVDETYVKVSGVWRYVYRAVDQHGQIIDVLVSARRDADAARRFFRRALSTLKVTPTEVFTDAAAVYPPVLDELVPQAWHHVERYANNPIEAIHSQLKHRLRPMRGLQTDRTAQVVTAEHEFLQNLRRGHHEIAIDTPPAGRAAAAYANSPRRSDSAPNRSFTMHDDPRTQQRPAFSARARPGARRVGR
ncbi:hypothetical protein CS0771_45980 [Catellatospora sp. IY07-71]|nr:IS6 family transposase [Catellatospora sp. IY07-71]BCJ75054.1 hypothetical protein CS0771_45980 [Catellatospora sp. IY07-71]